MSVCATRRGLLTLIGVFLLTSISAASDQSSYRHGPLATLGGIGQTISWELPANVTPQSTMNISYKWDWVENTTYWPKEGTPAKSEYTINTWGYVNDLYQEKVHMGVYAITALSQTTYVGIVELSFVGKDQNGVLKIYSTSSYNGYDGYYNIIDHEIYANDWN